LKLTTKQEATLRDLKELLSGENISARINSLDAEVYHHLDCPGMSNSKLGHLARGWVHFIYSQTVKEESDAMNLGSALHDAILLPDRFARDYAVIPRVDGRTKEGKEIRLKFLQDNIDKNLIDQEQSDLINGMSERIKQCAEVQRLFASGDPEVSFFWTDHETKILCKGRTDFLYRADDHIIIIDIKTTQDAGKRKFQRSIADYNYDRAAAFYLDGVSQVLETKVRAFAYIAIESKPPHDLGLYVLGERSLETGRKLYRDLLSKYKIYSESKIKDEGIRGFVSHKEFEMIELPGWAMEADHRI
jgi:hypothetical protein